MAAAYSKSFFIYFFLGTFNNICKTPHSINILYSHSNMSDIFRETANNYLQPTQDYPPRTFTNSFVNYSSNSQVRNVEISTPQHSRISNLDMSNTQFIPKIIESGYIVGPPIAYTQQPYLPPNFASFSPNKPIPITQNNIPSQFSPSRSRAITPPKVVVNPPPPTSIQFVTTQNKLLNGSQFISQPQRQEETVPKIHFDRCVNECKNWETKYNELYLKYMNKNAQPQSQDLYQLKEQNNRLKSRIRQLQNQPKGDLKNIKGVKDLIEKYKQSTLKECYLLLDRYRLECRQNQR